LYHKIIIILFIFSVSLIRGQDSHYWTNQYGTDAQLLSGLVVGSVNDLSSTFYNPGAVSLTSEERLILGIDAVEFVRLEVQKGLGKDNPAATQTRPTPSMFAFRFLSDSLQKNHFAVSVLVRNNFDTQLEYGVNLPYIESELIPDLTSITGEYYRRNYLNETWIGFSWSHRFKKNIGIGVTQYVAVRSQNLRNQNVTQLLGESGPSASSTLISRYQFWHARLLWKFGLLYNDDTFSWGISLTTPSIAVVGNGSTFLNYSLIGSDLDPRVIISDNEDVSVVYNSPFAVAVGVRYKINDTRLFFSSEYFAKVSTYRVMDLAIINNIDRSNVSADRLEHSLDPVLNLGLGFGQKLTETVSLYASFITNNSGINPDGSSDLAFNSFDIYHFSVGSSLALYNFRITLGIGLSFGEGEEQNLYNSLYANPELFDQTVLEPREVSYRSLKLLFGFATALY
jgi:hypothetical protein